MNSLERSMVETLTDLRENHYVAGVKAEFEAEGTRIEEAMRLKEVVSRAGLELTIKIGGCEALKDMHDARSIGVNAIVAPMIESSFALRKFLQAARIAFPRDERDDIKLFVNIETITAFRNLGEILGSGRADGLDGIIIGRGDLSESVGRDRNYINSEEILGYSRKILAEAKKQDLLCGMGGGVSADSLPFFNQLPADHLDFFETRKVQFSCPAAFTSGNSGEGILKAVGFELMWLKNKQNYYGGISREDEQRIRTLESKYRRSINEVLGRRSAPVLCAAV